MRINLRQYKGSGRPCSPIVYGFLCRKRLVVGRIVLSKFRVG